MPLFSCPECGNQVSTRAESCPKCGCPLDSVTPALTAEATPALALELTGHYSDDSGYVFDFVAHLQTVQARVKGHFDWMLVELPLPLRSQYAKKVGQSGSEFVEGSLEGRQLKLGGYKVDKPQLLGLGDYVIVLSEDGRFFEGTTRGKDGVAGQLRGTASRIA
jgi:hypothetical protein